MRPDDPLAVLDSTPRHKRRVRVVVRSGLLALVVLAFAAVLFWATPRSSEVAVQASPVCVYEPQTFEQVALVSCEGPDRIYGIANRSQTLIAATTSLGTSEVKLSYVAGAGAGGVLRIDRGWFGSTTYTFIAPDGTATELKETRRYIGAVKETLEERPSPGR